MINLHRFSCSILKQARGVYFRIRNARVRGVFQKVIIGVLLSSAILALNDSRTCALGGARPCSFSPICQSPGVISQQQSMWCPLLREQESSCGISGIHLVLGYTPFEADSCFPVLLRHQPWLPRGAPPLSAEDRPAKKPKGSLGFPKSPTPPPPKKKKRIERTLASNSFSLASSSSA